MARFVGSLSSEARKRVRQANQPREDF